MPHGLDAAPPQVTRAGQMSPSPGSRRSKPVTNWGMPAPPTSCDGRWFITEQSIGTIVIAKSQRFLYLVRPNVAAIRYTIGVGRQCTNAVGLLLVSAKEGTPESRPTVAAATPSPAQTSRSRRCRRAAGQPLARAR